MNCTSFVCRNITLGLVWENWNCTYVLPPHLKWILSLSKKILKYHHRSVENIPHWKLFCAKSTSQSFWAFYTKTDFFCIPIICYWFDWTSLKSSFFTPPSACEVVTVIHILHINKSTTQGLIRTTYAYNDNIWLLTDFQELQINYYAIHIYKNCHKVSMIK